MIYLVWQYYLDYGNPAMTSVRVVFAETTEGFAISFAKAACAGMRTPAHEGVNMTYRVMEYGIAIDYTDQEFEHGNHPREIYKEDVWPDKTN